MRPVPNRMTVRLSAQSATLEAVRKEPDTGPTVTAQPVLSALHQFNRIEVAAGDDAVIKAAINDRVNIAARGDILE